MLQCFAGSVGKAMTKPIKDYRFECAEGCRKNRWRWTSYYKAIRDMKNHGMNRKRGQGHGGGVRRKPDTSWMRIR